MKTNQLLSVLVADDNETNRRFVAGILEYYVSNVLVAESGERAVSLALETQPELLILDLHMPGIDGLETLRQILRLGRETGYRPHSIALTADTRKKERSRLLRNGFDACLIKPLRGKELIECIRKIHHGTENATQPGLQADHLLDDDAAIHAVGEDKMLLGELRSLFRKELSQTYQALEHLLQQHCFAEAAALVHKLRASAGYCGATKLQHNCADLEQVLRARDLDKIALHYTRFIQNCEVVKRQLDSGKL